MWGFRASGWQWTRLSQSGEQRELEVGVQGHPHRTRFTSGSHHRYCNHQVIRDLPSAKYPKHASSRDTTAGLETRSARLDPQTSFRQHLSIRQQNNEHYSLVQAR